ncbi:tetratricopeptide repeat protein [Cytophagaceae bacterium DM2B3-1]|uniref:Tetratricopeptide repeat protein n=1 Tax=Xanthocytophaga flava TaxID=3048013 RepID=A0ABT7CGI0_9BACT|nr:tetratricopeptide repeat protein [Xanthocytophaga flavus]MDJ1492853.1 tetratricopeptide repeat protein [Xanthocytophaga flavus]
MKKLFLYIVWLSGILPIMAQVRHAASTPQKKIDSLKNVLEGSRIGDTTYIKVLNNIGKIYLSFDDAKAMEYSQQALLMSEANQYSKGIMLSNMTIGGILENQQMFDKSIVCYQKAADIAQKFGYSEDYAMALHSMGGIYFNKREYVQALHLYQRALTVSESIHDTEEIIRLLNNIGYSYVLINESDTALVYLEKALAEKERLNKTELLPTTLNNMAICYQKKAEYHKAIALSLRSLQIAQQYNQWIRIKEAALTLSELYAAIDDYKQAFYYRSLQVEATDTLFLDNQTQTIADISTRYEVSQKEEHIVHLTKERHLQLTIFGLVSILLASLAILFYYQKQRHQRLIQLLGKRNEEIEEQKKELKLLNDTLSSVNQNLEELVIRRTQDLQKQNEQLREYAFINSHKLRLYVSRLQGLLNIMPFEDDSIGFNKLITHLVTSTEDLDKLTREISRLLEEKGGFDRHDLSDVKE